VPHDDAGGHRHARLERVLLDEIRALLRDDVSDPDLAPVVVTAIALSVDYRHARVHFALSGVGLRDRTRVERALLRATPFLRAQLGDTIELTRVPDLRFVLDAAAASPASLEAGEAGEPPGGSPRGGRD
jgi:ribosome-binding factor A